MTNSVFCIGELLIDFFCTELNQSLVDGTNFVKQAGGAPANVCASVAKLGGDAMFCGKVGQDSFGQFLKQTLEERQVDTSMLVMDEECPTTLAFVSRQLNGERDFIFNRGADGELRITDLDATKLQQIKVGHFGSATALLKDPFQTTYLQCMHTLKAQNVFISFDPNYRADLWKGQITTFVTWAQTCMVLADFVKMSEEELTLITGIDSCEEAVSSLHEQGVRTVAITLGERGTYMSVAAQSQLIPSMKVQAIDTTGAGDAFVGAMLKQIAQCEQPKALTLAEYEPFVRYANIVGALVCEGVGAMEPLPTEEQVKHYL